MFHQLIQRLRFCISRPDLPPSDIPWAIVLALMTPLSLSHWYDFHIEIQRSYFPIPLYVPILLGIRWYYVARLKSQGLELESPSGILCLFIGWLASMAAAELWPLALQTSWQNRALGNSRWLSYVAVYCQRFDCGTIDCVLGSAAVIVFLPWACIWAEVARRHQTEAVSRPAKILAGVIIPTSMLLITSIPTFVLLANCPTVAPITLFMLWIIVSVLVASKLSSHRRLISSMDTGLRAINKLFLRGSPLYICTLSSLSGLGFSLLFFGVQADNLSWILTFVLPFSYLTALGTWYWGAIPTVTCPLFEEQNAS